MKNIFKKLALVMALAMIVTSVPGLHANAEEGPQVTSTLTYYLGKTESAKLKTWNRTGMDRSFTVADKSIATVDAQGYVTGHKIGTTTVTCTFTSRATGKVVAKKEATVKVRRNADFIALGDAGKELLHITDGRNGEMEVGKGIDLLKYIVRTTGAEYKKGYTAPNYFTGWGKNLSKITDTVVISSSNPEVLAVNDGTITPLAEGTATLTLDAKTWSKGATTATKSYNITVKKNLADVEVYDEAKLVVSQDVIDNGLTADGKSGTVVTFELYKGSEINADVRDVQVQFSATRGSFAQDKVTLQNGKAYVFFQSEISTTELTAKLLATVVAGPKDLVGIQAAPVEIKLIPAKGNVPTEDGSGAKVTTAVVEYADRITLYFNKPVNAASLKNNYNLSIIDDYNTDRNTVDFTQHAVINMEQKADDAITFILDENFNGDPDVFTDNSSYRLEFVDNRYPSAPVTSTLNGVVTEISKPAVLSVTAINLKQIMIKFSEPMDKNTVLASNIAIDGVRLDDFNGTTTGDNWGAATGSGIRATVAISDGTTAAGKGVYDDGTVVPDVTKTSKDTFIVTLGKDKNGKQIYIGPGTHVLTIYNVCDFAGRTDKTLGNKIINSSLNFGVTGNDKIPTFEVVAQSPEQFKVTFNCAVEAVGTNPIANANSDDALLKLQYQLSDGSWASVKGMESGTQDYEVIKLDEKNYLIEVKKDWAADGVLPGEGSHRNNYFNYKFRVFLAKDSVYNVSNGKQNADCSDLLDDAVMNNIDITAPTCEISWNQTANATSGSFTLKFNEPIQAVGTSPIPNAGYITPSKVQDSVPVIHAMIYEVNRSKQETWDATVSGIDRENKLLTINAPALTAGKEYELVVRGVSDDIGNTANFKHRFTVTGNSTSTGPEDFYITKVVADRNYDSTGITGTPDNDATNATMQAVYVYFSTAYKKADAQGRTVLTNTNWTINGVSLPNDATIVAGVIGDNTEAGQNGVTILLPVGTIMDVNYTVVTLSKNVLSDKDVALSKENRVVTPYVYQQ